MKNQEANHLSMEELTDYLEQRLAATSMSRVEAHLASGCPTCQDDLHWLRETLSLMATDDWVEPPAESVAIIKAAARRSTFKRHEQGTSDAPSIIDRLRALFYPRVVSGAVAVALIVLLVVYGTETWHNSDYDTTGKATLATEIPTLSAAFTAAFIDDFEEPSRRLLPEAAEAGWSSGYENGMYVMTANFSPSSSNWERYQGLDLHDFTLNVEAQRLHGPESDFYGIVFRVLDNQNYYLFQISDNGLAKLVRFTAGTPESLTGSQPITNDQPNRLTVDARGSRITVSVNSKEFHTLDDDQIGHGTIGFIITNTKEPLTVSFDNLVVEP